MTRDRTARVLPLLLAMSYLFTPGTAQPISSLAKNDPYPMFTTLDPHTFLQTQEKLRIKEPFFAQERNSSVELSISAYGQTADRGRDPNGRKYVPGVMQRLTTSNSCDVPCSATDTCMTNITCIPEKNGFPVELGDINGRLNMVALLLGQAPDTLVPTLKTAYDEIAPTARMIDPTERLGCFSIPIRYRKYGMRFHMSCNLLAGLGITIRAGIANINQRVGPFRDLTCFAANCCPDQTVEACTTQFAPSDTEFRELQRKIQTYLMREVTSIANELCLNICDFNETSLDEIRVGIFWSKVHEINRERPDWPHVLACPFIKLTGSFSPVRELNTNRVFSAMFANNRHHALGIDAGINFDFVETIEAGIEIGATHFFGHNFCNYRMPTYQAQRVFFPAVTDVHIKPGFNWHVAAKIAANHFIDKLSFFFQFITVNHKDDSICMRDCRRNADCCATGGTDTCCKPQVLECLSAWRSNFANIAFNYDISPNIGAGLLWQAPLYQRNSYRSTTLMLGLYATF